MLNNKNTSTKQNSVVKALRLTTLFWQLELLYIRLLKQLILEDKMCSLKYKFSISAFYSISSVHYNTYQLSFRPNKNHL